MALDPLLGQVIGGYKVESEIGRGAMGVVYKARDVNLHRVVALKVLAPQLTDDATLVKRFVREARAAARLSHPNIVTIHQAGEHQGVYFIAMEYVEGKTLAQCMGLPGKPDVGKALDVTLQAAKALVAAHAQGIVHRDVNPRNIMVDSTGRVRVLDFGLAKVLQGRTVLTSHGATPGTPAYMAPEQVNGEDVDERTDIYSLGATLYEMLTGQVPYCADTPLGVMREIAEKPFPILMLNNVVPHPVVQLVSKMTNRNPNYRYPSAELLCADIARLLKDPGAVRAHVMLDAKAIEEIVSGPRVGSEELVSPTPVEIRRPEPPIERPRQVPTAPPPVQTPEPPVRPRAPQVPRAPHVRTAGSRRGLVLGGLVVLVVVAGVVGIWKLAGRDQGVEGGWVTLFNGKDFSGWVNAKYPGSGIGWQIQDGAVLPVGENSFIKTIDTWRDFEFEMDYRVAEGGDGGVYLRGRVCIQTVDPGLVQGPGAQQYPHRWDGSVTHNYSPIVNASKPVGEWNHLRVIFEARTLTAFLNDQLIHDHLQLVDPLKVYADKIVVIPGALEDAGPIMLEVWSGKIWYRNIRIRPLESAPRVARSGRETNEVPGPGWIALFNGKDFTGWQRQEEPNKPIEWAAGDGAIIASGQKSHIRTLEVWRDFEFAMEYKVGPGGDGGVFLRGRVGIQVIDDGIYSDPRFRNEPEISRLYDGDIRQHGRLAPASNPIGEWNRLRVIYAGNTLSVYLNDMLIHDNIDVTEPNPNAPLAAPDGMTAPGPIVLQAWEGIVWYRNLRIRPIGAASEKVSAQPDRGPQSRVRVEKQEGKDALDVYILGQHFATYQYSNEYKKPFLWPVKGQAGVHVTRDWPMQDAGGDGSTDHVHQKSLWTAHSDVNGVDFWGEDSSSGRQRTDDVSYGSGNDFGWIRAKNTWCDTSGRPVLSEEREYRFYATPEDARLFDVAITFRADHGAVNWGDTKNVGLTALRVRPSMEERRGGVITTSTGRGSEASWGKPAAWCDYSGDADGSGVRGIAIMDHPENLGYPAHWAVRDYGFVGANNFGCSEFYGNDQKSGSYMMNAGDSLTFNYRIYVHSGGADAADVARRYVDYTKASVIRRAHADGRVQPSGRDAAG